MPKITCGGGFGWNTFQKAEHKAVMAANGSCTQQGGGIGHVCARGCDRDVSMRP